MNLSKIKRVLPNRRGAGEDEAAGCGCFLVIVIATVAILLPAGTLNSFIKYFFFIFAGLNILALFLESYIDLEGKIQKKSRIITTITNESCLEYCDFLQLIAKFRPENFHKSFTKKSVEDLKKTMEEFDFIYATLLAKEEKINNYVENSDDQASFEKDLINVQEEYRNTQNGETRRNLNDREQSLKSKLQQIQALNSAKKQLKIKRQLIADILEEMHLKITNIELKMEEKAFDVGKELQNSLAKAQTEIKIVENAIDKIF